MKDDLSPRQRHFAEAYAACGNASEAARKAGYSIRTATSQGGRLLRNAHVAARITQLQAEAAQRAGLEVDDVIDMLMETYRDAKADHQHGPATRCVELLGKHLSMFKDRISFSEEQSTSDDDLIERLSGGDAQKRAMLRACIGAADTFDVH